MKKLLLLIFIIMLMISCVDRGKSKRGIKFPEGAYEIIDAGDGWYFFKIKDREFMYHGGQRGTYQGFECITELSKEEF